MLTVILALIVGFILGVAATCWAIADAQECRSEMDDL